MTTAQDVFNVTMSLIDELSGSGAPRTSDTLEYEHRTPAIITVMLAGYNNLMGITDKLTPVRNMDDLLSVEDKYAIGVMTYGLATELLLGENPVIANYFRQCYEQEQLRFAQSRPAEPEPIVDVYGGIEYGRFSR